ncbi:unnamed protein product [Meloidogyne enterolobii]|uniref:Uncharacterized protein n=1 Tax=Meloidogyne enterolobii TaxID=390850 RepID=A0ACB0XRI3_MELEN
MSCIMLGWLSLILSVSMSHGPSLLSLSSLAYAMCIPLQICLGAFVGFVINRLAILSDASKTVLIRPKLSSVKRSSNECEIACSKFNVVSSFALITLLEPGGIVVGSKVAILTSVTSGKFSVPKFRNLSPIQIFLLVKSNVTFGNVFNKSHPNINW